MPALPVTVFVLAAVAGQEGEVHEPRVRRVEDGPLFPETLPGNEI